jgi:hypothetical protein
MYLPEIPRLALDTQCLMRASNRGEDEDDRGIPLAAIKQGFPNEGLDSQTLVSVVEWTLQFQPAPDDELLFDAFLPSPGSPDPPSLAESRLHSDAQFLAKLGPEDPGRRCAASGCLRGAVRLSVLCREHHFESIYGRVVEKN